MSIHTFLVYERKEGEREEVVVIRAPGFRGLAMRNWSGVAVECGWVGECRWAVALRLW